MWVLGHIALGYLFSGAIGKLTDEKPIIPIIWIVSLLPDLDLFTNGFLTHRGPSHSILVATAIYLPIFLITRKGLPYFAALTSHTLIGDYFAGTPHEELFWPLSTDTFAAPRALFLTGTTETLAEVSLFALMIIIILTNYLKSKQESSKKQNPPKLSIN